MYVFYIVDLDREEFSALQARFSQADWQHPQKENFLWYLSFVMSTGIPDSYTLRLSKVDIDLLMGVSAKDCGVLEKLQRKIVEVSWNA